MDCPRCGAPTDTGPECPRCGVILAKAARAGAARARPGLHASPPQPVPRSWPVLLPWAGLLLLVAAAAVFVLRQPVAPRLLALRPTTLSAPVAPAGPAAGRDLPPLPPVREEAVPLPDPAALAGSVPQEDVLAANRLIGSLRGAARLGNDDIRSAERLFGLYPEQARSLLVAVLLRAAQQADADRQYAAAASLLDRVLVVSPGDDHALRALLTVRGEQADWPAVETLAGEILRSTPGDSATTCALAYALVRQDRSREAVEILQGFLDGRDDPAAAALLARLRQDVAAQAPLQRQTLSHFHLRYDGEAHEDVGREVLRVLEAHYATLARTFDEEPPGAIPVTLLSRQSYFDSTGAPAWSGGIFDSFDGGVRIPIGGLTTSLTPGLDRVVVHELTHAFVAERSGSLAPRQLHEGLAQMMEGRRIESSLDEDGLRALADGRIGGVHGFYLGALAFVEDLVAQRGQGGINDVLAAMARTRSVDAAFRDVYGRDFAGTRADSRTRLRQRYGS